MQFALNNIPGQTRVSSGRVQFAQETQPPGFCAPGQIDSQPPEWSCPQLGNTWLGADFETSESTRISVTKICLIFILSQKPESSNHAHLRTTGSISTKRPAAPAINLVPMCPVGFPIRLPAAGERFNSGNRGTCGVTVPKYFP